MSLKDIVCTQLIILLIILRVSESADLCRDNDAVNFTTVFLITFENGSDTFSNKTPADYNFTTSHNQSFTFDVNDGMFAFVNEVPDPFNIWHGNASDYTTNDNDGYMFLVNVQRIDPQIFNYKIDDLHIGRLYEFSAYVANVVRKEKCLSKPNIRFEVRAINESGNVIAKKGTGDVPACYNMSWSKYGIPFETTHSSVVLLMISNDVESDGNDVAIDDIELRVYSTNDLDDTSTTDASTTLIAIDSTEIDSTETSSTAPIAIDSAEMDSTETSSTVPIAIDSTETTTTITSTSSTTPQHSKFISHRGAGLALKWKIIH
ncbi:unnamed protein product [Rotaria socialis]|uniref:Uncharacterized protein n=1 Tax=Rotaria socialis TaxID=392032 RepID=A0A821TZ18_9BILA|nr:unnamed protein product [Rotaria socialis]